MYIVILSRIRLQHTIQRFIFHSQLQLGSLRKNAKEYRETNDSYKSTGMLSEKFHNTFLISILGNLARRYGTPILMHCFDQARIGTDSLRGRYHCLLLERMPKQSCFGCYEQRVLFLDATSFQLCLKFLWCQHLPVFYLHYSVEVL